MGNLAKETEAEIDRRLAAALEPGSPNQITAAELREWTSEYLRDREFEVANYPHIASEPHWDLSMMDARFEDALFAVLVYYPHGVEFFCGTGNAFDIKRFAESEFPDDPGELFAKMRCQFNVPEKSLHLSREAATAWLNRGW